MTSKLEIDLWLRSWSLRGRKNVSVLLENRVLFAGKPLRLFFSSRKLSISSIKFSFFSIWTVWPRYARSDNCPISKKKNLISEMKSSLSEKKLRLQVFPALSSLFPAARNIYSVLLWNLENCTGTFSTLIKKIWFFWKTYHAGDRTHDRSRESISRIAP